jgi:hypothetical protein
MNKRIRELAKKAGAIRIHGVPKDHALVGYENIEKFAKFIIEDDELNYSADHANKIQAEIESLKAENWHLKHQLYLLVKEQSE